MDVKINVSYINNTFLIEKINHFGDMGKNFKKMSKIQNVSNYLVIVLTELFVKKDLMIDINFCSDNFMEIIYDNSDDDNDYDKEFLYFKEKVLDKITNVLEILVDIREQEDLEIKKIQAQFRKSRYDPSYKMCMSVEKKIWEGCSK